MCKILANTRNMPREAWLSLRRKGIGGSDAGAVCGVNPYANAMSVYRDKLGLGEEKEENEAIRQGRDLEDYVAVRFMEATGLKVRRSHFMYQSSGHPFMIADVDRLVVGEDAGLECKTASAWNADKWKDGDIPLHYILQCMHYMEVTGKRAWYIAALILGQQFICQKISWNEELAGKLVEIEKEFWECHVLPRVMPEPDGSKICDGILKECFGMARGEGTIALAGFDEKLERREQIVAEVKQLQQEQKQIEQEVKLYMKENARAASDRYMVSWGNVESRRLDTERLKAERPDIYAAYAKVSASRRFEVHAA